MIIDIIMEFILNMISERKVLSLITIVILLSFIRCSSIVDLEGVVTDESTHDPIDFAKVQLTQGNVSYTVFTDSSGNYLFRKVKRGYAQLSGKAYGHRDIIDTVLIPTGTSLVTHDVQLKQLSKIETGVLSDNRIANSEISTNTSEKYGRIEGRIIKFNDGGDADNSYSIKLYIMKDKIKGANAILWGHIDSSFYFTKVITDSTGFFVFDSLPSNRYYAISLESNTKMLKKQVQTIYFIKVLAGLSSRIDIPYHINDSNTKILSDDKFEWRPQFTDYNQSSKHLSKAVIVGRIINMYKEPVPQVTLYDNENGRVIISDFDGYFIQLVSPGNYNYKFNASPYLGDSVEIMIDKNNIYMLPEIQLKRDTTNGLNISIHD